MQERLPAPGAAGRPAGILMLTCARCPPACLPACCMLCPSAAALGTSHSSQVGSLKSFGGLSFNGKRLYGSDGDLAASMPVRGGTAGRFTAPMYAARRKVVPLEAHSSASNLVSLCGTYALHRQGTVLVAGFCRFCSWWARATCRARAAVGHRNAAPAVPCCARSFQCSLHILPAAHVLVRIDCSDSEQQLNALRA